MCGVYIFYFVNVLDILFILNMLISQQLPNTLVCTKDNERYQTQFKSPYFILNKNTENSQAYYVQNAIIENNKRLLYLGPNEVFFNQVKAMMNHKKTTSTDIWNQTKEFDYIYNLRQKNTSMYWPFYVPKFIGMITVHGYMTLKKNTKIEVLLDNTHSLLLDLIHEEGSTSVNKYTFVFKMKNVKIGFHSIQIRLTENNDIGRFHYLKLVTWRDLYVVRERWRPLAAHASLTTKSGGKNDAWILSVQPINPSLGCFSPITTPFGYYGAVIEADGSSNGVNFSLWSYGRHEPKPPTYKLSRLLAIGDPYGIFGEYGHEGTGVKIRNFNPWKTNSSQIYTLALKYKPDPNQIYQDGQIYTYFSYYWDELNEEWKLYGIGEEFRKKHKLFKSLTVGSFVEVPGVAEVQRTNHVERVIQYNGYLHNKYDNKWRKINNIIKKYTSDDMKDKHTNKQWKISNDNKFQMIAGGIKQYDVDTKNRILSLPLQEDDDHRPLYMHPTKLAKLDEVIPYPNIISHHIAETEGPNNTINKILKLIVEIPDKDYLHNTVYIYCGPKDGLTILSEWPKKYYKFNNKLTGTVGLELPYNENNKYYRVLVKDKGIQVWSRNTYIIN